jgi:hypothetical protein
LQKGKRWEVRGKRCPSLPPLPSHFSPLTSYL